MSSPEVHNPTRLLSSISISRSYLWVGGEGSLLRILAASIFLMAQPGIAVPPLPLQTTGGGHWVTVEFKTPPAGPRTPGTEPGTEPCKEVTGLKGSGTLRNAPG